MTPRAPPPRRSAWRTALAALTAAGAVLAVAGCVRGDPGLVIIGLALALPGRPRPRGRRGGRPSAGGDTLER